MGAGFRRGLSSAPTGSREDGLPAPRPGAERLIIGEQSGRASLRTEAARKVFPARTDQALVRGWDARRGSPGKRVNADGRGHRYACTISLIRLLDTALNASSATRACLSRRASSSTTVRIRPRVRTGAPAPGSANSTSTAAPSSTVLQRAVTNQPRLRISASRQRTSAGVRNRNRRRGGLPLARVRALRPIGLRKEATASLPP
jgi:hypothetical protein